MEAFGQWEEVWEDRETFRLLERAEFYAAGYHQGQELAVRETDANSILGAEVVGPPIDAEVTIPSEFRESAAPTANKGLHRWKHGAADPVNVIFVQDQV